MADTQRRTIEEFVKTRIIWKVREHNQDVDHDPEYVIDDTVEYWVKDVVSQAYGDPVRYIEEAGHQHIYGLERSFTINLDQYRNPVCWDPAGGHCF